MQGNFDQTLFIFVNQDAQIMSMEDMQGCALTMFRLFTSEPLEDHILVVHIYILNSYLHE